MIHALETLAPEEERDLVRSANAGDRDALARLVQAHVRFIRSEARKYAAAEPLISTDDLVSAGIEGFMRAVITYDPDRGARLLTHARASIGEAMSDEVATTGRVISVPGRTLRRYRKALRETDSIEAARALVATWDRMDVTTFDAVHHAMTGGQSSDESFSPSSSMSWHPGAPDLVGNPKDYTDGGNYVEGQNLLGDPSTFDPETSALAKDLARQALASITDDRQRAVISLAYLSGEDLSDGQIAERLGLSRPTVTRARNAALSVMRSALGA